MQMVYSYLFYSYRYHGYANALFELKLTLPLVVSKSLVSLYPQCLVHYPASSALESFVECRLSDLRSPLVRYPIHQHKHSIFYPNAAKCIRSCYYDTLQARTRNTPTGHLFQLFPTLLQHWTPSDLCQLLAPYATRLSLIELLFYLLLPLYQYHVYTARACMHACMLHFI